MAFCCIDLKNLLTKHTGFYVTELTFNILCNMTRICVFTVQNNFMQIHLNAFMLSFILFLFSVLGVLRFYILFSYIYFYLFTTGSCYWCLINHV